LLTPDRRSFRCRFQFELQPSTTSRERAHEFYERLGYVKIKTQYAFIKSIAADGPQDFRRLVPRVDS